MFKLTSESAASTPVALTHPGPRQAALEYFHGEIGPAWACEIDGVAGYLTALPEEGGVRFVEGPPPAPLERTGAEAWPDGRGAMRAEAMPA